MRLKTRSASWSLTSSQHLLLRYPQMILPPCHQDKEDAWPWVHFLLFPEDIKSWLHFPVRQEETAVFCIMPTAPDWSRGKATQLKQLASSGGVAMMSNLSRMGNMDKAGTWVSRDYACYPYSNKEHLLFFKYPYLSGGRASYTNVWWPWAYKWHLFLFCANTMSLLETTTLIFFFLWVSWHWSS